MATPSAYGADLGRLCSPSLNACSPMCHALCVSLRAIRPGHSPGGTMTTTAPHQVTLSARTAIIMVVAFLATIALAVSLPLALRSTHTVFVKTISPATSHSTSVTGSELTRAAHGG